jgi:hypothetical protein
MSDATQEQVFAFLGDPGTHGGTKVQRVDTHAATLFLTPQRVLKIKRAVQFPFLDYSTLAKRKAACESELAVNKPYAPEIYRGVIAITRAPGGGLAIGGTGEPVEWAVEMERFDETCTLDHLAQKIDEPLADALGSAVAAAHAKTQAVEPEPWIAALGVYIAEHVEAFSAHPDIFPAEEVGALARADRAEYGRIRPLLVARGRNGLIRRIHGDLHLGNIVLIDGRPVLFDAIEFSPIIASGDVLYDLAFLLMDLLERGLAAAANVVLNRYLAETRRDGDLNALTVLPFFIAMRAAIRAKVTAARMERAEPAQRAEIARSARGYFDFARRAVVPPAAACIAIGGLSGTGKTVLARALAPPIGPMPGAVILRSDVERKALFGVAETEKLPTAAYTEAVTARVYRRLVDKTRRVLAAGHGVVVDAVFARPHERADLAAAAQAANVSLRGLFLTADLSTRIARVGARAIDASDADEKVARAQEDYDLGALDWIEIDASGTPEETLKRATETLFPSPLSGGGQGHA